MTDKERIEILEKELQELKVENKALRNNNIAHNEARLRSFIEQSDYGIFFLDKNGVVYEWNKRAEELIQINKDKFINQKVTDIGNILANKNLISEKTSNSLLRVITAFLGNKSEEHSLVFDLELLQDEKVNSFLEIHIYPIESEYDNFYGGLIRDISREKKTEREFERYQMHLEEVLKERTLELINSENRIRNLSDSLPGGAIFRAIRKDGNFVLDYVSKNFYELLSLDPAMDFDNLDIMLKNIHPEDLIRFNNEKNTVRETLNDFHIEVRYFMQDGSMRWFQVRAKANVTNDDTVFWDGYIIDTTEKNIYHTELQEREALLKSVIENIPYDFWALDYKGRYFIQSITSKQYWGELLGATLKETNIPDASKIVLQNILYKVEQGELVNEENELYDVRGKSYFFQNIASPLIINDRISGALGFNIDITERKIVEKKLVQNEVKFRNIFNNSTDGIVIHSAEGDIYELNSTIKELHQGKMVHSFFDFIDEEAVFEYKQKLGELTKDKKELTLEAYMPSSKDAFISIEIKSSWMDYLGKKAVLSIIRDVSYRKRFERQLLDAVIETEEKERAQLAADLHDEIGPLLSSMKLYISLLKETTDIQKSNYVGEQIFTLVTEAITSVREISNSLSPHVLTNYGLIEAVKNVIQSVSKFISISFSSNCEKSRFSSNTETVYYRIFRELLNNTIKHAQAKNVEVSFVKEGDFLTFIYKDDGKGFEYEKEFENKKEGMGLFNIINRAKTINAKYVFRSKPGEGTCFEMTTSIQL